MKRHVLACAGPVCLLLLWWAAAQWALLPAYALPSPGTVARALFGFMTGLGWEPPYAGAFWQHALASSLRVLGGFLTAVVCGIPLGVVSARCRFLGHIADPVVHLFRSVPGITWLPIAMVWFGIGNITTVFLIALAGFFPIYVNTLHGVRAVPEHWERAARMLGASHRQLLLKVVLPGSQPSIESGLRVALGVAWAYVVLGELTGVDRGLGAMIMDARMMGHITAIIVGMLCIAVLGRLSDLALMFALRHMKGHQP